MESERGRIQTGGLEQRNPRSYTVTFDPTNRVVPSGVQNAGKLEPHLRCFRVLKPILGGWNGVAGLNADVQLESGLLAGARPRQRVSPKKGCGVADALAKWENASKFVPEKVPKTVAVSHHETRRASHD